MKEELVDKNLILDHIDHLLEKYPKNYFLLVLVDFINSLNTKGELIDKSLILDHIDYLLEKYPKNYYLLVLVDFINSLNTKELEN